jgi:tRNA dimethylallyltransferase
MGPTASGKTDLAIDISQKIKSRLISVDSALIYKGMDIGTAKPDSKTLAAYPHYLINICKPSDAYSAQDFITDAKSQIQLAFDHEELPILVGGTSFYQNQRPHQEKNTTNYSRRREWKLCTKICRKLTLWLPLEFTPMMHSALPEL